MILAVESVVGHTSSGAARSFELVLRGGAHCVESGVTNYQGFQHELGTVRVGGAQLVDSLDSGLGQGTSWTDLE